MDRKRFIQSLAAAGLTGAALKANALNQVTPALKSSDRMPVLFLGHGSPMNAIEENEFVAGFRELGRDLPQPQAILVVSAHWETRGTRVTAMEQPRTIHDFGGFPAELYAQRYPAPGSPTLAQSTKELITTADVGLDHDWGLDHGAWTVVKHLYPMANVPVIQLSLDYTKPARYHYELARELSALRDRGVLIIGSGNMVHNLRMVAWDKFGIDNYGYDWAVEARERMNAMILNGDHRKLIDYRSQGRAFDLAIPSPDHYLPLLYALALQKSGEGISLFNDKAVAGSLTMTSVKIGAE